MTMNKTRDQREAEEFLTRLACGASPEAKRIVEALHKPAPERETEKRRHERTLSRGAKKA
jgi:hypothetical protein